MDTNVKRPTKSSLRQWLAHPALSLGAALAYMALIHRVSSIPGRVEQPGALDFIYFSLTPTLQNLLHVPAFALLAMLWSHVLPATIRGALLVLLITVGYGAYDEWFQLGVPGRYGSLTDLALDMVGALVGIAVYRYLVKSARSIRQSRIVT